MSSKDTDEEHVMHPKSDNKWITINDKELFESLLSKYQIGLEAAIKRSSFDFDHVGLLYYKSHKINLNRGGSYIDSPVWIKNKKDTINQKNNDNKCFQYAATLALNHKEIRIHSKRISKIKSFMDKYNWKEINFSSGKNEWKKLEKNYLTISLNMLHAKRKKTYILPTFENISQIVKNKLFFWWSNIKKNGIILRNQDFIKAAIGKLSVICLGNRKLFVWSRR